MRVVHLSTSDVGHGAGVAAFRLHQALKQIGVESRMLVAEKRSDDPDVLLIDESADRRTGRVVRALTDRAEAAWSRFAPQNLFGANELRLRGSEILAEADVVNLHAIHWTKRYIPFRILTWLARRTQVVWTLHDMWALTGHCIYSQDCTRWRTGCGECPDLDTFVPIWWDTTRSTMRAKRYVYERARFTVVCPSTWLAGIARESPLFAHHDVRRIPYGVDTALFAPRITDDPRRAFDIAPDARVMVTIAHDFGDRRKGTAHLQSALDRLPRKHDGSTLLSIGRGDPGARLRERFKVISAGFVSDPERLAMAYSAGDLLVFPSIADNLPNVVLESLACATPVVSFDVGGIPDMIRHLENGYLAPLRDDDELSRGIARLLSDSEECRTMGRAGRARVEAEFSYLGQAHAYSALYESLLRGAPRHIGRGP